MRLLFIGDVVGRPGRRFLQRVLPALRTAEAIDVVVVNAENCAGGSGLTPANYQDLVACGVDGVTLGDHIYRRAEIRRVLEREGNIVKPANYPAAAPGREWMTLTAADGTQVAVVSVMGRVFMRPVDCPFTAVDRALKEIPESVKVRLVDVHAEATSDKQLLGRYLDGRVSAVLGTHTHVPTADECILPGGTAFQCDVGMTGPHSGVLGRRYDRVVETTVSFFPTSFDVADGDLRLNGAIVDVDPATGQAQKIQRLCITERDATALVKAAKSDEET